MVYNHYKKNFCVNIDEFFLSGSQTRCIYPRHNEHIIFGSFVLGIHFGCDSYSLIFIDSWWPQSSHISDTFEHVLSVACFPLCITGIFVFIVSATSCAESGMAVSIYQYPVATFRTFKLIISKIWCTAYDSL